MTVSLVLWHSMPQIDLSELVPCKEISSFLAHKHRSILDTDNLKESFTTLPLNETFS